MAGFLIAMISGALMSIQGVWNTNVTKQTNIWVATGFVQVTAFLVCVLMWLFSGRPQFVGLWQTQPKYSLLGGVIGAFITFTVIKAVSAMGVAGAEVTIVVTQVAVAYLIELFGLFGGNKTSFSLVKLGGLALAVVGVVVFHMCGNSR